MNINIIILHLFLNKELFNKYSRIISLEYFKNNNTSLFKIFLSLFELHKESTENITVDQLALQLYTLYPRLKDEEKYLLDITLQQVADTEVDETLALAYLEKHHQQALSTEIAIKALDVSQGRADFSVLRELVDASETIVAGATDDEFVSDDLEILINNDIASQGLRWRLNTMNKTLGSLRKGDFGFIYARPETGKTTFLASEVTHMAQQAKEVGLGTVLWFNNEEQGEKVMRRCFQAVFGITKEELYTNYPHYKAEYEKTMEHHLRIFDSASISKQDVERLCKKYSPSLILFDQIDKIKWPDSERYDLKMKAIYAWARELAKTYAPFIGICQAGGTAEGKKYLNMNDVDSSHTAKQGEADFMIGIGKTNNDGEEFQRFISLAKNKLDGDVDTSPDLRHAKVPININPSIARYSDVLEL